MQERKDACSAISFRDKVWSISINNVLKQHKHLIHISVLIHMYLHSKSLYNQSKQTAGWPSLCQLTLKADVPKKKWQVNMKTYSGLGKKREQDGKQKKNEYEGEVQGEEGASRYCACLWCWAYTVIPQSLRENESTSILFWPTFSDKNSSFSPREKHTLRN